MEGERTIESGGKSVTLTARPASDISEFTQALVNHSIEQNCATAGEFNGIDLAVDANTRITAEALEQTWWDKQHARHLEYMKSPKGQALELERKNRAEAAREASWAKVHHWLSRA